MLFCGSRFYKNGTSWWGPAKGPVPRKVPVFSEPESCFVFAVIANKVSIILKTIKWNYQSVFYLTTQTCLVRELESTGFNFKPFAFGPEKFPGLSRLSTLSLLERVPFLAYLKMRDFMQVSSKLNGDIYFFFS